MQTTIFRTRSFFPNLTFFKTCLFAGVVFLSSTSLHAASSGITTIALTPDGGSLFAGASNRVIYVMDAESLKVKERHWVKFKPTNMEFTADGSILLLHGNHSVLRAVDPKTFAVKKKMSHAERYAYAPGANKIILASDTYKYKEKKYLTTIRVVDASTYKEELKFNVVGQIGGLAVDDAATTVSLVTYRAKNPEETKEKANSDMSKAEKIEFRQKHDQSSSEHVVISLKDGSSTRHKSWFSISNSSFIKRMSDGVMVVPSWSGGYVMKDSGETIFMDTGVSSQNSAFVDTKNNMIITGGYSSISIKKDGDEEVTEHKLKRLKDADRVIHVIKGKDAYFASTDGFRVVRFIPGDGIEKVKPVF